MWKIVRRVMQSLGYCCAMGTRMPDAPLASVLAEMPGCWVALDRRTKAALAAAETPYKLLAEIRARQLTGIAIVRAPDPSEPELVGLG